LYGFSFQELLKGRVGLLAEDSYFGGWGFSDDPVYYNCNNIYSVCTLLYPLQINNFPNDFIKTRPLFKKNPDNMFLYSDSPVTLTEAKIEELLANEIPALTFAAGHRGIKVFGTFNVKRNFDIRDRYLKGTIAPWVLRETTGRQDYIWKHSDFINVAYPYLYRLFDDLVSVTKGNELQ
jgi:hypothetical protein